MCDMVLNMHSQESLLVAFWEVSRWLSSRQVSINSEWVALVVVLFSLAVPFLDNHQTPSTPSHRRKKSTLLRSSSGSAVDLTNYDTMHDEDYDINSDADMRSPTWNWLERRQTINTPNTPRSKHSKGTNAVNINDANERKNSFLIKCVGLAKEYTVSPSGETALGPEGYLPTSINKNREQRCNAVPNILLGLHVLYEESKLDITSTWKMNKGRSNMVVVMAQLGRWLGWKDWTCDRGTYYEFESANASSHLFEFSMIDGLQMPAQPFEPPSIYAHLETWIAGSSPPPFLTLARLCGVNDMSKPDDPVCQQAAELTPRTLALLSFMRDASDHHGPQPVIETLLRSQMNKQILETLPDGVAGAFHQAIASMRYRTTETTTFTGELFPRSDGKEPSYTPGHQTHGWHVSSHHEALRDYHSICSSAHEAEALPRWDASSEADRHAVTKLIFNEDRRFPEASRLVNQTRPPVVECTPEPEWTEVELLEAQKELAQHVTRRTLSVAAGRGMMHFNARVPLLTEKIPVPAFSLQCIMKPRNANDSTQAMTFSADKSTFSEEKVCWAFFHNGASMGLMISKDAGGIDTSWVLYNKPPELTNRHAGFLLALGLNGHLKSLAKWVAFKYLTPKHTMTSVGLLLGLSASFLGTMDTLITRLLSVHVTRLLPPGAAELNLSPLTQTTGIMGIGLLYYNTQHRRMSEVMLSEVENNDAEEGTATDTVLRDEGYRLAAGFSLGLVNLGQGKRLHGLHDIGVVERLLTIAVGTKNVNMVHVLDRATAGAVMAVAFIFLKTNDEAIARKVDIPDTLHQFDYVRPDIFLLRTLARHLIMWDAIVPTKDFIEASLPEPYRRRADLRSTKFLSTEDMPFFNTLAGICFAMGLRFAGSQRADVRDLLVLYLDQFLRLSRLSALSYDARVTLNSVRNCLDTLALAAASVMAGSGDLLVMRRLRALHGRTDKDTPFGSHLAAHMALGALFLAGGTRTFGTSNLAIASLCIAFYPVFPNDVLDNRGHLQALRHLWVLAVEGRCLVARDASAGGAVIGGMTGLVHLKDGTTQCLRLPGLIPDLDTVKSIEVQGEGFWDASVNLDPEAEGGKALREKIQTENAVNVTLHRRAAYDRPPQDLFTAELQALNETQGVPSVDPNSVTSFAYGAGGGAGGGGGASKPSNPFAWVFGLESLKDFDHAERALVLGRAHAGEWNGAELGRPTVLDSRLALEKDILPPEGVSGSPTTTLSKMQKDKLWQLRLLFAWFDRWEREDEAEELQNGAHAEHEGTDENKWYSRSGGTWLRREVIERLRWRVWNLTTGSDGGGDT
jgi:anaphase-promoting complex subunit 1